MKFSKDRDLAMCEMQHRIDQLEKALEHLRDMAQVNGWERDQDHIDAPCGDEPQPKSHILKDCDPSDPDLTYLTIEEYESLNVAAPQPPSIFDEIAGTNKVKTRDIPFKFMTMYVTKEDHK